jgi:YD repeat-containing protein
MKKLLTGLLAAALLCNLCACAQPKTEEGNTVPSTSPSTPISPDGPTDPTAPAESAVLKPTVKARLERYRTIVELLLKYSREDRTQINLGTYGNIEALKYCYDQLMAMEDLDPYLNEASWKEHVGDTYYPGEMDRKAMLERFTILQDVLISMDLTILREGKPDTCEDYIRWRYDTSGNLCHIEQKTSGYGRGTWRQPGQQHYNYVVMTDMFFQYDADGNFLYTLFGKRHDLNVKLIPTYDKDGRLIREGNETHTLNYRYNDRGDLSEIEHFRHPVGADRDESPSNRWVYSYEYDANGTVTQRRTDYFVFGRLDGSSITRYTYNDQGLLAQEVTGTRTTTYTYDTQGRLLIKVIADPSDRYHPEDTETYHYGDLYMFDTYRINYPE